jgi:hypothetical protein
VANVTRIDWIKVARHYVLETIGKEMAGYSKTPLAQKLEMARCAGGVVFIAKNAAGDATARLARFGTYP